MAQPDEAPPDPGVRNQRARRYRRRLRSRIILSFLLLSFTLTALFAVAAVYVGALVEDQAVGRMLERNVDEYAERFYRDTSAEWAPLNDVRAIVYGPDKRHNAPPDWAELDTGVYSISGEEGGRPFVYRLVVKKDP